MSSPELAKQIVLADGRIAEILPGDWVRISIFDQKELYQVLEVLDQSLVILKEAEVNVSSVFVLDAFRKV